MMNTLIAIVVLLSGAIVYLLLRVSHLHTAYDAVMTRLSIMEDKIKIESTALDICNENLTSFKDDTNKAFESAFNNYAELKYRLDDLKGSDFDVDKKKVRIPRNSKKGK